MRRRPTMAQLVPVTLHDGNQRRLANCMRLIWARRLKCTTLRGPKLQQDDLQGTRPPCPWRRTAVLRREQRGLVVRRTAKHGGIANEETARISNGIDSWKRFYEKASVSVLSLLSPICSHAIDTDVNKWTSMTSRMTSLSCWATIKQPMTGLLRDSAVISWMRFSLVVARETPRLTPPSNGPSRRHPVDPNWEAVGVPEQPCGSPKRHKSDPSLFVFFYAHAHVHVWMHVLVLSLPPHTHTLSHSHTLSGDKGRVEWGEGGSTSKRVASVLYIRTELRVRTGQDSEHQMG